MPAVANNRIWAKQDRFCGLNDLKGCCLTKTNWINEESVPACWLLLLKVFGRFISL